jgi:hypothetical protein
VTVHVKNIPLKLWSRAVATRILEDFGEPVFLDDVSFDGQDRRVVYTMVDCHNGRMILKSVIVHVGVSGNRFLSLSSTGPPLTCQPLLQMTISICENSRGSLGLRIALANP